MAVWPVSLPQLALSEGYEEAGQGILLRSEVDIGPAKVRPLQTSEIVNQRIPLLLTTAQVATLDTFFKTTIVYGSLPFDWINQRTGAVVELRMLNRPAYTQIAGGYWRTTIEVEQLP